MDDSHKDTVTVEWQEYGNALGHDMWQFYMSKKFSDVTLSTDDGQKIQSHRLLLAISSKYFRDLFDRNPSPNPVVSLANMRFDIVQMILQLISSGTVEVPSNQMRSFLKAATFLELQGFEHASTLLSTDGNRAYAGQLPPKEKYSIRLEDVGDENGDCK